MTLNHEKGENMRNLGVENAGGKTTLFYLGYEALESVSSRGLKKHEKIHIGVQP